MFTPLSCDLHKELCMFLLNESGLTGRSIGKVLFFPTILHLIGVM